MLRQLVLAAVIGICGCYSQAQVEDGIRTGASMRMSCPKEEITVSGYVYGGSTWVESGCGREFSCRLDSRVATAATCVEAPASKERTLRKVVVERVVLDSGCSSVKIVRQTRWRQGSEQAYRLEGCGKAYTCTTAAGRTECRLAIAQPGGSR